MRNCELMVEESPESMCGQHWVKCTKLLVLPGCEAISTRDRAWRILANYHESK